VVVVVLAIAGLALPIARRAVTKEPLPSALAPVNAPVAA
jgi:hypothetical protein